MSEELNQRAQNVLKILIERHIQDGIPIGSKTIAEEYALGLSPATIRNILAELEDAGYLASPHTSAGRVPTELGYRVFVNHLLTIKPLEGETLQELKDQLNPDLAISDLIQSTSQLLSSMTKMVGVVSLTKRNRVELRQVEFLPLSSNRVLVILVLNNREVQNRIIYTDRPYTASELQEAANYLNAHCQGKDLMSVRQDLMNQIANERENMQTLLTRAADIAGKAFVQLNQNKNADQYVVAGQNHFLQYIQESNLEKMRALFEAFTQKQEVLNLLNQALDAEGVQIFIGKESGFEPFDHCSIVTASYSENGQLIGSLGVIGPKRMPYDRIISAVDITAKLLTAALNQA